MDEEGAPNEQPVQEVSGKKLPQDNYDPRIMVVIPRPEGIVVIGRGVRRRRGMRR